MKSLHRKGTLKKDCSFALIFAVYFTLNNIDLCFAASNYTNASCGVRTSYFIAKLYGKEPSSLSKISDLIDESKDGTSSLAGISKGLSSLGLQPRGRHLTYDDLLSVHYPTVLHLQTTKGSHFVVFGGTNRDEIILSYLE